MKKKLMLLIASLAILPGIVLGGDVLVNNTSNMNTQCNSAESKTYWFYLTESMQRNPYDNFINNSANSYITKHDNIRTGTSVDIWRHGNVISNCTNWNRTSTAVPKSQTKMIIQNQDGCTFNIPSYTKTNNPSAIDAQIHYNIGFVQFNYGSNPITDHLYYTTYGGNIYCFGDNPTQVNNGSNCPTSNITYSKEYFHVGECLNYKVFWCGDGLVNSETGTTYNNGTFTEQCDYNDPNHTNWGTSGCTQTCQQDNTQPTPYCGNGILEAGEQCEKVNGEFLPGCTNCSLDTPQCSITVNPNQGNVPQDVTVTSDMPAWATVVYLNMGTGSNIRDPKFPFGYTYTNAGTYPIKLKVRNNYDKYNVDYSGNLDNIVGYCYVDFNGTVPSQQPQCNSAYSGNHYMNNPAYPDWLNAGTSGLCLEGTLKQNSFSNWWDGSGHAGHYSWICRNSAGSEKPCRANQYRCGDGIISTDNGESCDEALLNGTPGHCNLACTGQVEPGQPILTIEKEQISTGTMEAGTLVAYKITVKNIGSGVATGVTIYDLLPIELQYFNSNISIVPNSTYHFTTGTIFTGGVYRDYILYTGITLNVNGTATVYPIGMVKNGFTFDTLTNCATVSGFNISPTVSGFNISPSEDCVTTTPPTPHLPHLTINKELLTTGDWIAGNTVAYKITLTNDGNATYYNAYILDILPNAIEYQTSSIQNINDYLFEEGTTGNNEYYIKYYNFDLDAGQSAIVYLTGELKQGFNYNQTTNCAMAPGIIDCEDSPLKPIPYIQKYQKAGQDMDPNSYGWTTNKLTVGLGEYISYRIDFGNIGNKATTGVVQDILPNCVEYVTGKLVDAIGVGPTYNKKTHIVQVINIPLQPRQIAHLMIIGQIKQVAGCENVYSYLNTGAFHFIGEPWQNSTVLAERDNTITDVEITKEVDTEDPVQPGQVVTYTINYENKGPEVLQSYTIVDTWPSELTFSGVVSMNPEASNYPGVRESNNGNKIVRWTFDTPLPVNGTGQIVIQGIVNDY